MPPDEDLMGARVWRTLSLRRSSSISLVLLLGLLLVVLVGSSYHTPPSRGASIISGGHASVVPLGTANGHAATNSPNLLLTVEHSIGFAPLVTNVTATASGGSGVYNLSLCTGTPNCERSLGWTGTPMTIDQRFDTAGNFTINATVTDTRGTSAAATALVEVLAVSPLATGAVEGAPSGVAPFTDTFSYTANGGVPPYSAQFVFGDGATASAIPGAVVNHTYLLPGQFSPTLTLTDSRGHTHVQQLPQVQVLPSPTGSSGPRVAGFSPSTLPWLGGIIAVLGLTGVIVTYVWRERQLRRESMELVNQLWEGDSGGPEGEP